MLTMRSGNPVLSDSMQQRVRQEIGFTGNTMTVQGAINKTFILALLVITTASVAWHFSFVDGHRLGDELPKVSNLMPLFMWGGLIGGLVFALVSCFKSSWIMVTAPLYAIFEGFFLGALSAMYELMYGAAAEEGGMLGGIAIQAALLTMSVLVVMLVLYAARVIRVTEQFRSILFMVTGAVAVVYLVSFVVSLFGGSIPYLHVGASGGTSWIGIGINLVIAGIAAFNLLLDFDFIERGEQAGLPKKMEWMGAFGLMVTLVWLYIELLRLLARLYNRE